MSRKIPDQALATVDDLDSDVLTQAQTMLGADSPSDAVNQALIEVVRRRLAQRYIEFLVSRGPADDPDEARKHAWRPTDT